MEKKGKGGRKGDNDNVVLTTYIMIICIHINDTLQILAYSKQQSLNLGLPVESYKKLFG